MKQAALDRNPRPNLTKGVQSGSSTICCDGLKWNEDYGNRSDVTLMLHQESDMARFAIERPVAFPAGTHWYYSSGATNIVSDLIRRRLGNDSTYYVFANTRLFNKIGMPDAVFEVDPSGTRIGSSYLYATTRDYARFGLDCCLRMMEYLTA